MKKFIVIATSILILVSCLIPSSAAAPLVTSLAEPDNFVDPNGFSHDFFCLFNDNQGILFEIVYKDVVPTVRFLRSDLRIAFNNASSESTSIRIILRSLTGGAYIGDTYMPLAVGESYTFYYSSVSSELTDKIPTYASYIIPYSSFLYYYFIPDYSFQFTVASNILLMQNTINWKESVGYDLISPLYEPVADTSNSFVVLQGASNALLINLTHRVIDSADLKLDYQLVTDVQGNYHLYVYNRYTVSLNVYMNLYSVKTGFYINSENYSVPALGQLDLFSGFDLYSNLNALVFPNAKTYGASFINTFDYNVGLPTIQWAYDSLLVEAVASQTLLLLNQLYQINRSLSQFEQSFFEEMEMVYSYFEQLLDVYNNPGFTFDEPSTAFIDDYLTDESKVFDSIDNAINSNPGSSGNLSSDLDSIFNNSNDIFNGSGSFALARYLLNGFIFEDSRLSSLIYFSLAMGLAVLVLGRRLSA